MPFAVSVSTASHAAQAVDEACAFALEQLGTAPELALVFYSPHHAADAADIARAAHGKLQPQALVGALGESIIGGAREIEERPALVVWLASWHGTVALEPFALTLDNTPDGPSLFGWPDALMECVPSEALLLTFGEPFTFPAIDVFLPTVNDTYPGLTVCGGMVSNPTGPTADGLLLNNGVQPSGAVGVLLHGAGLRFRPVVSQGCRPIGRPLVVTKGQDNIVQEVGGQTPVQYLRELLEAVPEHDKSLMQRGLFLGLALSEYRDQFRRGDFVIRNLLGLDPRTGALAVTDRIRVGQTIQFHVRDAVTAREDWSELLHTTRTEFQAQGGLLFSCNGRGTRFFDAPNHDAQTLQQSLGTLPLAGFFAAGELGPIGGRNFIHGFTASSVLFG